ncbi:MAG: pilus assembly protein PilM [Ruminococcus sp.]|nr:pilus assembly protein PilM [Ruminococcus sp.]
MLSFDITDRNIRVVKGTESNGKIRISSAATLNVEEGLIVNGHVKDVPNVATLINGVIKKNKMPDKEAIVSISSNLTIFKEMTVAKGKPQELQKTVKQQMQAELNLDDTYSVSYIVVGDAERTDERSEPAYKILATACPNEIINSYREVFKYLGISLKSLMIGCNCITKVLLADTKIKSKMPLLAVQIDNNFISLNLYEQGQLSFSRFASIDSADYGYSEDYVFEAVNENIFRMLQFHRSRNTGETIENVIFYGDTHDYVRLTDELEKLDLKTSLINVPPQIHGHENLEFSLYANAIGAMFKRNKDTEKINLLETDLGTAVKNKIKDDSAGNLIFIGAVALSLIITGGWYATRAIKAKHIKDDIKKTETFINSPDTAHKLEVQKRLVDIKGQVDTYKANMDNLYAAYLSQPVINGDKFDALHDIIEDTMKEYKIEHGILEYDGYTDGQINLVITVDAEEEDDKYKMVQEFPAECVKSLLAYKLDKSPTTMIGSATYPGYAVEGADEDEKDKKDQVTFSITVKLNGRQSAYVPEDEEAETEAAE